MVSGGRCVCVHLQRRGARAQVGRLRLVAQPAIVALRAAHGRVEGVVKGGWVRQSLKNADVI